MPQAGYDAHRAYRPIFRKVLACCTKDTATGNVRNQCDAYFSHYPQRDMKKYKQLGERVMRYSISSISVAAAIVCSGSAFAADLGARPVPVVAPPVINWTGFYVGVHGGYGRSDFNEDVDGWFAGGQVGYNYQFANRFVFGVEADLAYANIGLTVTDTVFGATISATTNIDLIGSLRGRIGYGFDRALIYATGGAAFTRHELSATVTVPPVSVTLADDQIHWGWTVGGGVEFLVTNNLTVKAEYLFSEYGEQTYFAGTAAQLTGSLQNHTAKLGLNWLFR